MPLAAGIIGGVGAVGAGVIGGQQSAAQRAAAQAAEQAALENYLKINVPDPAQQQIILQKYQQTGQIAPQIQQAMQQQKSGLQGMEIDPTSREAEVAALNKMQDVANSGGMDAQAKQQEAQAMNAANANEAGQRGAILQNYAARGIGGSGAQLAAELSADQGSANSNAAAGMNSAAGAEQRALQAMTAGSQMAGTLNNQDYSQAANAATAQDAINKFNTQNAQNVAGQNTKAINDAQAQNTVNNQNLANANVDIGNQQERYNKGLIQQQFNNQMGLAGGKANAENGVANAANQQANATGNMWSGIGQSIAQTGGAVAGGMKKNSDQETEE